MKRLAPYVVGLFFVAGFACNRDHSEERDDENFREDVVACEEAVARVETCCPEVAHPSNACRYHHYAYDQICGCDSTGGGAYTHEDDWPVFDLAKSRALADAACAQIACDDMRAAFESKHSEYTSSAADCQY